MDGEEAVEGCWAGWCEGGPVLADDRVAVAWTGMDETGC